MSQDKVIAVIGLGYVGLPLALLASRKGYRVIGIDIQKDKIDLIKEGKSPFVDESVEKEIKSARFEATTDFRRVKDASIIVICVPTPVFKNHLPNLEPVESACRSIGTYLKVGQLVILESTVNPGVSEGSVLPILEETSGLVAGKDFFLAHCPERINPGDKKWNVSNIPRVVGSLEEQGLAHAVEFYSSILDAEVRPMKSLKEAESVKIIENSFRDINLAFVNEVAMFFSRIGVDVMNVINGAATKPFSFLAHYPGCGVGGHCIPVDPYYLIEYAKQNGFKHNFLSLARKINNSMPLFTVDKVVSGLKELGMAINGTKVAVLGLAYKANIDDCRESPSFHIIEHLKNYGAEVITYDPFVPHKSDVPTLDEALSGAKAMVVATAHSEFESLSPDRVAGHGVRVVIDGRNCLSKEAYASRGLIYQGIGR